MNGESQIIKLIWTDLESQIKKCKNPPKKTVMFILTGKRFTSSGLYPATFRLVA
jgi:hypothetical protein